MKLQLLILVGVVFGSSTSASRDKCPIAYPKSGPVRGTVRYSRNDRPFYSFTGIPYAQPPIGENRFRAPKPIDPWEHVLEVQNDAPACIQKNYLASKKPPLEGQEDCLYLNVYTPKPPSSKTQDLLPVMVFIHWGGFFTGYSNPNYLGPEYFMDEDVVLVTFNYRLGVMGFLSTDDDASPGNWGLKDQVAALNWIRSNVEAFSGDKNLVTIFGQSAGSASVHYHLLSPLSRRLFHRAISQSGSALNLWARPGNQVQKVVAGMTAKMVGCEMDGTFEMVECLREVEAGRLVDAVDNFKTFDIEPLVIFTPVTEKKSLKNPKPFLVKDPVEHVKQGDFHNVPWIVGVTEEEGILRASALLKFNETREQLNANFDNLMPAILGLSISLPPEEVTKIWKIIKDFYFEGTNYVDIKHPNHVKGFIDLFTDRAFLYGIFQGLLLHASNGHKPIWFYNFNYRGAYTYTDYFANTTSDVTNYNWGASHCDDLIYLFKSPAIFPDLNPHSSDVTMSKIMVKMWANFAKYGNPTPAEQTNGKIWEPVQDVSKKDTASTIGKINHLNITGCYSEKNVNDNIKLLNQNNFVSERLQFLNGLPFFEKVSIF